MKRLGILCLVLGLICGCDKPSESVDNSEKYRAYNELIIKNNYEESSYIPFDRELVVAENEKGEYVYDVVISNPKVAMYRIEMIAVDVSQIGSEALFPCIGVLDDDHFHMIPNQSNPNEGFYSGITINGVSKTPNINLSVMVVYYDYYGLNETKVFFNLSSDVESEVNLPDENTEAGEDETYSE